MKRFLRTESAGGTMILVAAAGAFAWANLAAGSYETVWHGRPSIGLGLFEVERDLRHWVNEGLMVLFFLVVGLEIKREIVAGELRDRRTAVLPIFGALGGMVVPALVFGAFNAGAAGARGWGIPMATDIAFSVGVLGLFGRGLPIGLKLFLLTLAIVDDLGAILVIAVFYAQGISAGPLAIAGALLIAMMLLRRSGIRSVVPYLLASVGVWIGFLESGIHASLAGIAIASVVPASDEGGDGEVARLEAILHPWTSYLVMPIFALANAGVEVRSLDWRAPGAVWVTVGVVAGLVAGKTAGITLGAALAVRAGVAQLPAGVRWLHLIGVAALGGIGFTVSLFIADLAYADDALLDAAKTGVIVGSLMAALIGSILLSRARPRRST